MTEKCLLATQKQPYDATYITHNNNSAVFVVRLIVNVLSHSDTLRSHGRKVDLLFCQKDLYLFVSLYRCFDQKLTLITISGSQGGLKMT